MGQRTNNDRVITELVHRLELDPDALLLVVQLGEMLASRSPIRRRRFK